MLINRKMLALSVTERSMVAVEVGPVNGSRKAYHAARFVYPEKSGFDNPEKLGKTLKQFLRKQGFSARRCVMGMEAKWLTVREKTLPPGSGDSLKGILSIMAEREFASDSKDLVFDYVGPTNSEQGEVILLAAASRQHVEKLQAIADGAGLNPAAITPSTMILVRSLKPSEFHEQLVLHLMESGVELAVQSKGRLRMLRRFSLLVPAEYLSDRTDDWLDNLVSELRRVLSLLPGERTPEQEQELHIWNGAGLSEGSLKFLAERIAPDAKLCKVSTDVDLNSLSSDLQTDDVVAAAYLGTVGLNGRLPGVDFLHSRLNSPKETAPRRRTIGIAATAVAVIAICVFLFLDWRQMRSEVGVLDDQLDRIAPSVSEARDIVDRTTFAIVWYEGGPKYLNCLRELTLAFPAEGRIWTTSLSIQEDMQVLFSGKAVNKEAVLEVLDRLKGNLSFSQVKPLYLRESGEAQREITFAISLNYVGSG